jgi:hypothetical protein
MPQSHRHHHVLVRSRAASPWSCIIIAVLPPLQSSIIIAVFPCRWSKKESTRGLWSKKGRPEQKQKDASISQTSSFRFLPLLQHLTIAPGCRGRDNLDLNPSSTLNQIRQSYHRMNSKTAYSLTS